MRLAKIKPLPKWLVFMSLLLVAYALLEPPFEGFDENAHYSRILDATQDMSSQFRGHALMREDVLNYPGPQAYGSGEPPFSNSNTYDRFYLQPLEALSAIKQYPVRSSAQPTVKPKLKSGDAVNSKLNWQYQHPPLYYLIAGVINQLLPSERMVLNVVVLRLFSVSLVCLGLLITFKGMLAFGKKSFINAENLPVVFGIFALCFPMFYFEFARIGNDALAFLFLSFVFYYSAKAYQATAPQKPLQAMMFFLALALLTKAIVLPLIPVFAFYVGYCLWASRSNDIGKACPAIMWSRGDDLVVKKWVKDFFQSFLLPISLGLTWYVFVYIYFGDLGIGSEVQDLTHSEGLVQGLSQNFNILKLLRGLLVPLATFIYAGSWSLVRAPDVLYFLLATIYIYIGGMYVRVVILAQHKSSKLMPLALFFFLYLGLALHVIISMALSGLGTSGGWYFYVLSPWLLLAISLSVDVMQRFTLQIIRSIGLVITMGTFVTNTLIYSGFIIKSENKGMQWFGLINVDFIEDAISRLNWVSYPVSALWFLGALMLILIWPAKK
ncbi:hypothetical protein [Polynucleobacter sp. UB-Raua-W9]|uniref:hypothetical protein n=1 Tax=Polynucleobacter sp. UB-Raua-W9 TaxID=1819736 RepID=UPI001BFD8701|nr:hypothetical protein [Polynucleobacter sp. UB-Raua-W9]QWD72712.1 hypothetical protein AOC07_01625 [Polynucleobacter sp. UB-Raua-W9]